MLKLLSKFRLLLHAGNDLEVIVSGVVGILYLLLLMLLCAAVVGGVGVGVGVALAPHFVFGGVALTLVVVVAES